MMNRFQLRFILFLMCMLVVAGCVGMQGETTEDHVRIPVNVPEIHKGILAGYLKQEFLPDSLALIPPPPEKGSPAAALDEDVSSKTFELRNTARWALAIEDANLMFPEAADVFSCALGIAISEKDTPNLYMLLRRTLADAGLSTYKAKNHYQRQRPFMVNNKPICTPEEEDVLRKDGSYPSGHTAVGWAWALILTEIAPDRADKILARGRAFGESRNVCNVHWHSDVVEGRFMGAATVARLHGDAVFLAQLKAARAEYADAVVKGLTPKQDCN